MKCIDFKYSANDGNDEVKSSVCLRRIFLTVYLDHLKLV